MKKIIFFILFCFLFLPQEGKADFALFNGTLTSEYMEVGGIYTYKYEVSVYFGFPESCQKWQMDLGASIFDIKSPVDWTYDILSSDDKIIWQTPNWPGIMSGQSLKGFKFSSVFSPVCGDGTLFGFTPVGESGNTVSIVGLVPSGPPPVIPEPNTWFLVGLGVFLKNLKRIIKRKKKRI